MYKMYSKKSNCIIKEAEKTVSCGKLIVFIELKYEKRLEGRKH